MKANWKYSDVSQSVDQTFKGTDEEFAGHLAAELNEEGVTGGEGPWHAFKNGREAYLIQVVAVVSLVRDPSADLDEEEGG